MMALVAVLAAQHFPRKVDDWEGLPAEDRTWRGRSPSISPTSNASAKSKHLGEVNRFVALMRYYLPPPAPSTAWEQRSTTWHLRRLTTPQSSSSSHRLTWRSPHQTPRSLRPTRSSLRLWLKSRHPPRRALLDHLGLSTNRSLGIIVGRMVIVSVRITPVQRAAPRPRGTRTRRRPPTRWEVATPTKDGTHVTPDGVGGRI